MTSSLDSTLIVHLVQPFKAEGQTFNENAPLKLDRAEKQARILRSNFINGFEVRGASSTYKAKQSLQLTTIGTGSPIERVIIDTLLPRVGSKERVLLEEAIKKYNGEIRFYVGDKKIEEVLHKIGRQAAMQIERILKWKRKGMAIFFLDFPMNNFVAHYLASPSAERSMCLRRNYQEGGRFVILGDSVEYISL